MIDINSSAANQATVKLNARREIILAEVRARLHGSDDPAKLALTNHLAEVDDWVLADTLNDTDIALLGNELTELRAIDAALHRIKIGNYGVCADCGKTIAAARMQAQLTAQCCIECQTEAEKRHGDAHPPSM